MQRTRAIASARAFLELPSFDIIVDIACLEPKEGWTLWEDSEGNRLRITKNKSVLTYSGVFNESTKDIFRKAKPELIAKHSYWVLAIFGKKNSILTFLGNDGILRSSLFRDKTWVENIPPILLGIHALSYISSGYMDNEPRPISLNVSYPNNFEIEEVWASGYPAIDGNLQEKIQCHLTSQNLAE